MNRKPRSKKKHKGVTGYKPLQVKDASVLMSENKVTLGGLTKEDVLQRLDIAIGLLKRGFIKHFFGKTAHGVPLVAQPLEDWHKASCFCGMGALMAAFMRPSFGVNLGGHDNIKKYIQDFSKGQHELMSEYNDDDCTTQDDMVRLFEYIKSRVDQEFPFNPL